MRCLCLLPALLILGACENQGTTGNDGATSASPRTVSRSGCTPVIDALRRAHGQERAAQYIVEGPDAPLQEPLATRIGDMAYVEILGRVHEEPSRGQERYMIENLEKAAAGGGRLCESLGDAVARGERVQRYRLPNPMKEIAAQAGRADMTSTMTLWISEDSGLPVYQETPLTMGGVTETIGTAWVFGDAVRKPEPGRK